MTNAPDDFRDTRDDREMREPRRNDRRDMKLDSRIPPHNVDAEASLLGSMMLDDSPVGLAIERELQAADFYKPAHQNIYGAIKALAAKLKGKPIDLLINNAGTLGDLPPQTVKTFEKATFETVLMTNVYGPLAVSEAFRENVAASQGKKIVALTSGLGSATLTQRRGGMYAYRASKGALNVSMRALAADLKPQGIIVGIVAPGMVETDLLAASGYKGPALKVNESVAGLMKVIDGVTLENNDKAVNYNGEVIPW